MAKHKYVTGALFDEDDDDSDVEDSSYFGNKITPQPKSTANLYDGLIAKNPQEQITIQKKMEIEQRTLEYASRSIALLCETEDIGIQAANELAHQGELLQNTNLRLDEIDSNLKIGQKHINGIKSVFHELKNYISGKSKTSPSKSKVMPKRQNAGQNNKFYDTNNQTQRPTTSNNFRVHESTSPVTNNCQVDEILEANLGEMAQHLTKLKVLGVEFGTQINHQNELIDAIQNKVEASDIKIAKQNDEMNKILGK